MPQLKHLVLLKFRPTTDRARIAEIYEALDELPDKIPGLLEVVGGPYNSPEGLHRGFTHAFVMTFADQFARDVYLGHPDHEAVKHLILEELDGGADGVLAFDFTVCDRFRYA